ncbi:conserved hypothetical protein [Trichodesmium erythraeum IMS101]|uniref:DUF3122 domain-containing protein n=1 Tax=Trichodesmium erythraeum (strain IMS101) TaxID=203124 RepID=Q10VY2_TRIEI|nr:DUF3122 domain-containing protein [Trichodesmium erythraeum GBRTRLIN201]MCH2048705.1 DUF3122 domain-containing protein [Trichodesmium sp. ALOHA_ZT_67]
MRKITLIFTLILSLYLIIFNPQNALASIHKYPESSIQIMYRSQQSLRDISDRAWQAVLYKRIKSGQLKNLNLRLVGFPGMIKLANSQKLQITTGTGKVWKADNVLLDSSFPPNVAEYNFLEVMKNLDYDTPLRLHLSLQDSSIAEIVVPIFAVKEWRQLFEKIDFW